MARRAAELLMSVVQPAELWHESAAGNLRRTGCAWKDRHDRDFCMDRLMRKSSPTSCAKKSTATNSCRKTYYIQTKFRDEARPFPAWCALSSPRKTLIPSHVDSRPAQTTPWCHVWRLRRILPVWGLFALSPQTTASIGGTGSHELWRVGGKRRRCYCIQRHFRFTLPISRLAPTLPLKGERTAAQADADQSTYTNVKTIESLVEFWIFRWTNPSTIVSKAKRREIVYYCCAATMSSTTSKPKTRRREIAIDDGSSAAIVEQFARNGGSLYPVGFQRQSLCRFATKRRGLGHRCERRRLILIMAPTSVAMPPSLEFVDRVTQSNATKAPTGKAAWNWRAGIEVGHVVQRCATNTTQAMNVSFSTTTGKSQISGAKRNWTKYSTPRR